MIFRYSLIGAVADIPYLRILSSMAWFVNLIQFELPMLRSGLGMLHVYRVTDFADRSYYSGGAC